MKKSAREKACGRCRRVLLLTSYPRNGNGLHSVCKDCRSAQARRRLEDPEVRAKEAAMAAARYERNKEAVAEKRKARYAADPQRALEQNRRWRDKHLEQHRAQCRQWAKDHPEEMRAIVAARRALKKAAGGRYGASDIAAMRVAQGNVCKLCRTALDVGYHVDHVIPLSRGGSNAPDNLQLLCPLCNRRKGAKLPHEFERAAA